MYKNYYMLRNNHVDVTNILHNVQNQMTLIWLHIQKVWMAKKAHHRPHPKTARGEWG